MQDYFVQEHLNNSFALTPGLQVGQLQLEIDIVIAASEANVSLEQIQEWLVKTPFWFFRRYNVVEFKSISDPLDEEDFARISARALLARAERVQIPRAEMISCIVTAAWPRNFLKEVKPGERAFKKVKNRPGVYTHPGFLFPIYLIVCNQLPVEEINYPLLVFSSGEKLKSYLKRILDLDLQIYINYVTHLHPEECYDRSTRRKSC